MTLQDGRTAARGDRRRPVWAAFLPPCYLVALLVLGVLATDVLAPYEGPGLLWVLVGMPLVGLASIVSVLLMLVTRRSPWFSPPVDALIAAVCGLGLASLLGLPLVALVLALL